MPRSRPLVERFWEKVEKTAGCWVWTGSRVFYGYGNIGGPGNKNIRAHRLSWELHNGPIPNGLCVLHTCDNPGCVRPDHLFLGTQKQNAEDKAQKGRCNAQRGDEHWSRRSPEKVLRGDRNGARMHGRPDIHGEKHPKAKVTAREVRDMRDLYATGEYTMRDLAEMYGLSLSPVRRILRRKTWKHVK